LRFGIDGYGRSALDAARSAATLVPAWRRSMALPVTFDHCVVHVSDWERSNAFYHDVLGAELVRRPQGWAYRFGAAQLNLHGPGFHPAEVARLPVQPGNSDLCFEWNGPIADAIDHLARCRVAIHAGPMERFGAKGAGTSVYFRDPDGSLLEFISYTPHGARS
jgi:catechol 2,3-dioxygenase-like lactoylglutathione lyase family enzyme